MAVIITVNHNDQYPVQNKQRRVLNSSGATGTITLKYLISFVSSLKTARWLNIQSYIHDSLYSYSTGNQ